MTIRRPGRVSYTDLGVSLDNYTNVSGEVSRFLFTGSQYVIAEYDSSTEITELNYWDTDGSEAVSRLMDKTRVLDLVFDTADNMYYAVRWGDQPGSSNMSWSGSLVFRDDFATSHPVDVWRPNESLWYYSEPQWGRYLHHEQTPSAESIGLDSSSWYLFKRNPVLHELEYKSITGKAAISTTCAVEGDFQAWGTIYLTTFSGSSSYFSMRLVNHDKVFTSIDSNNLIAQASVKGSYVVDNFPSDTGAWESANVYFDNDSTAGAWNITNFRLVERNFDDSDYSLSWGTHSVFTVVFYQYSSGDDTNYFKVENAAATALGYGAISNTKKEFHFVQGPIGFTLVADPSSDIGSIVGTSLRVNIRIDNTVVDGDVDLTTVSGVAGFKVGVGIAGTNVYTRRDYDGEVPTVTWQNINVYNLGVSPAPAIGVELFADCIGGTTIPDFRVDNFEIESATGTVTWPTIPSLTLETFDATGSRASLPSVSDAQGVVVASLDVLNLTESGTGEYSLFRSGGFTSVATDHTTSANGGSVFLAFKRHENDPTVLMKFKKSVFPISSLEAGDSAEVLASGTMDNSSFYRNNSFVYTTFSGGHLAYFTENWADISRGHFVNTVLSGTLSGTNPRNMAWVQPSDHYAWNVNDTDALYGVTLSGTTAGQLKLYNMTPTTASFCNVVPDNRMLAAGTNTTTTIKAQVMNIYGESMVGKTVNFSVISGDGALSPAASLTNVSGEASTTYTVGTAVNTTTITAAVNI